MTPDQAAHAILRGDYSIEAAEVWIAWRQKHNATMIMDRLCAWLVHRVKELEATYESVPRGTEDRAVLSPSTLRIEADHLRTSIMYLEETATRLIHRCSLDDVRLRQMAQADLRQAIHGVFNDALTLLDRFAL